MAHIINLPVSFEFRTAKVQWTEVCTRLVGWWKQQDGTENRDNLIAEVANGGSIKTLQVPLAQLTDKEREKCLATLGKPGSDKAVEGICSAIHPRFFIHACKTYITDVELMKHSQPADAWHMREDFLRLKPEGEAALSFLNKWGQWRLLPTYADLYEMMRLQQAVREALTSVPGKWFASAHAFPTMVPSRPPKHPYTYFTALTHACQVAIRMTTTIDLLRKLKFKSCARRDCRLPFPVTSKHSRIYCSQYCGHLESVRRNRETTTTKKLRG